MTAPPQIRVIATDLDGTLLTSEHAISPRTERALKAAMARGVQVILATGKTVHSRQAVVARLGIATPGVFSQGLVLVDADGTVLYRRDLDAAVASPALAYAEARGYNAVAIADGGTRILSEQASALTAFMEAHHEPPPALVGRLSVAVQNTPITKALIEVPPAEMPAVRAELAALLGKRAVLVQSMPQLLEILPPGASKGDGLRRLLAMLDISPDQVLALGDAENDLEMLTIAGIGVAMGNASPDLKAAADYVTASNDKDGVALAVERFVLQAGNGQHPLFTT
ncbi:MAG: Cof-type HAD-IIB family hydrolase [Anaerolineae bacterium]